MLGLSSFLLQMILMIQRPNTVSSVFHPPVIQIVASVFRHAHGEEGMGMGIVNHYN